MLSEVEHKQYSRHLLLNEIGLSGQKKLKQSRVLIIGAGGLGCPVLQYLTAAGVGTIGIIDHDIVDQTNLQRQILYSHNDIGKHKAIIAAKKLSGLNPYTVFKTYTDPLNTKNAINLFNDYDIIIDASDNFPTRYLINDAAILCNKPFVFGSIYKFEGQVSVFNYKNGPTYRCLYPNPPQPETAPNCSEIGVLGVLPGIIGCLQANEVLKMICDIGDVLSGKLLSYNALNMQQLILNITKNNSIIINNLNDNYDAICGISQQEYTLAELKTRKQTYKLLDVRSHLERDNHHIGGIHMPLDRLEQDYKTLPPHLDLVVYCQSGARSKKAITLLKEKGFTNTLINLKGGLVSNS